MEEYTQITLDQWMQWKEDIRRKLAETASNFVYIGYRLKQIRDSGMYDGATDIFEFAKKEYNLGKSTVSRFIAINEKYSEGGNSLELREEFRNFSSSKLSEMLTLPDNEIQLITEKTTIREIRALKDFNSQASEEEEEGIPAAGATAVTDRTPLEKCVIDFFNARKEMLNSVMECLEAEPPEYKRAAEIMAPSGQASHKKGIVFLFLYDWNTGIKYKLMTVPEPVAMNWPEFLNDIYHIFGTYNRPDVWSNFYKEQGSQKQPEKKSEESTKEETENTVSDESNQRETDTVATSQQGAEEQGQEVISDESGGDDAGYESKEAEDGCEAKVAQKEPERVETEDAGSSETSQETADSVATSQQEREEAAEPEQEREEEPEQIPGQDTILNHPEYLPESYQTDAQIDGEPVQASVEQLLREQKEERQRHKECETLAREIEKDIFAQNYEGALKHAKKLIKNLEVITT